MIKIDIERCDDKLFESRFANRFYGDLRTLRIGNIVSFLSPVELSNMKAEEAMNLCVEIPDISVYSGVCFQKLFITNIANILGARYIKSPVEVLNNDIVVKKEHTQCGIKQLDGIASMTKIKAASGAILMYVGLYNKAGDLANPRAFSLGFEPQVYNAFMKDVGENFYHLANSIFLDTTKI